MSFLNLIPVLSSAVQGLQDALPVVGTIKQNIQDLSGGKGKVNYVRLVTNILSYAVQIYIIYLIAKGSLEAETGQELLDEVK